MVAFGAVGPAKATPPIIGCSDPSCLTDYDMPIITVFLTPASANTVNASANSTGWLHSERYHFTFDVYVDHVVHVVYFERDCIGKENCATPDYQGIACGNPLMFHEIEAYGTAYGTNNSHAVSHQDTIVCN